MSAKYDPSSADDDAPVVDGPIPPPEAKRPWWQRVLRGLGEFGVYLVVAMLVVTLVRLFALQPFNVPTGSMEHTVEVGDSILVWKPGAPVRGQIVVFRDDLGWLTTEPDPQRWWERALSAIRFLPPGDDQYLVKRLIGLPGDHVTCCNAAGQIEVNGQPLEESGYLYQTAPGTAVAPSQIEFDLVVPAGRIFVMGDHRNFSSDSRYHMCAANGSPTPELAFPSLAAVQGRAFAVFRPLSRAHWFDIPPTFAAVPDPGPAADPGLWSCPLVS
jgi:signal peptidase I